jgi:ABC-type spermidine/putrescine transport system permease subunit II
MKRLTQALGPTYMVLIILFLVSPILVILILSLSKSLYLEFPPNIGSLQSYRALIHNPSLVNSLVASLIIASSATAIATFVGTLAALGVRKFSQITQSALNLLFLAPLFVPYVVLATGVSHIYFSFGLRRTLATIVAHSTIALPYVFLLVKSGLRLLPRSVEEAANVLGATPLNTMLRVTIPLLKPQIIGGMMFAFIASFGEFIIAYMLSGPTSQTLPVYIYSSVREKTEPAITALLTLIMVFVVIFGVYASRFYGRKV